MEDKCYYCNKRVIVGGISMCIYDLEDTEDIITGIDVSECPNLLPDKSCKDLIIDCKNVFLCRYKAEESNKEQLNRRNDVHKSREQRISPSNCERNHRLLNE